MSAQFAGVASAVTGGYYKDAGIDLKFLPICPVGHEMKRVRDAADSSPLSAVTVGSIEQNIFIPTLREDPALRVRAVAAMFRTSPLCLASFDPPTVGDDGKIAVGAHEDTVSLIERILKSDHNGGAEYSVVASPRATKNTDLKSGKFGAIQAYQTTEVPTLERDLREGNGGKGGVLALPMEGMNGAKLGYSQVLFAPEEDLESDGDKREVVRAFLDATFRGWETAIRDLEAAASSVEECKSMISLDDENNDHWDKSFSYTVQNVGLCCDAVKQTFQGDRYGSIDADRWNEASNWLLEKGETSPPPQDGKSFGLDPTVWQPSQQLIAGNELARRTLEDAKTSASLFSETHGRRPSLAVVTVGELGRYTHGQRRLEIYSCPDRSWFSKETAGDANGFDVNETFLPETATTDEVLSELYRIRARGVDGVQLMWPLPDHVDAIRCYEAIDPSRDVDGAHFIGRMELGNTAATAKHLMPPVTPAAVLALMEEHGVEIRGRKILVVGRSRIVGMPLAYMAMRAGGTVTITHSGATSSELEGMVRSADVVLACAGSSGLLKADWVKPGTDVINVGTTFVEGEDRLVSDFEGDLSAHASRFSPVPGGVGPLSTAHLFKNVAKAAWNGANIGGAGSTEALWSRKSGSLERTVRFGDYDSALAFTGKVNEMSGDMDHHANMTFKHHCSEGVEVSLSLYTYEANEVTDRDYEAARKIDEIVDGL